MVSARPLTALLAASLALLAWPAAGHAAKTTFGSDLKAPAEVAETHGADAVFWGTNLPGDRAVRVPRKGQVTRVRLKGTALRPAGAPPPVTLMHFQILRPVGRGRVKVMLTSAGFRVPVGGDRNRVTSYRPVNLCARRGDYVAFNNVGGFQPPHYPNGTPFRVFSGVTGSTTGFYTRGDGTNNGAVFRGSAKRGRELLMQMVLTTGRSVSPPCR
jgi:hypothetical protein